MNQQVPRSGCFKSGEGHLGESPNRGEAAAAAPASLHKASTVFRDPTRLEGAVVVCGDTNNTSPHGDISPQLGKEEEMKRITRFKKRTWVLLGVVAVIAAMASVGAYAYWTSSGDGPGTCSDRTDQRGRSPRRATARRADAGGSARRSRTGSRQRLGLPKRSSRSTSRSRRATTPTRRPHRASGRPESLRDADCTTVTSSSQLTVTPGRRRCRDRRHRARGRRRLRALRTTGTIQMPDDQQASSGGRCKQPGRLQVA